MSTQETNSLIDELKNLNKDLKGELNKIKIEPVDELSTVINSLSGNTLTFNPSSTPISAIPIKPPLNEDGISDFIIQRTEELVMNGLETVKDLQLVVAGTLDAKAMQGYANIMSATTAALDTLNNINLEKKKIKAQRELKELDIAAKKEIGPSKNTHNTLNIVASRENILKMLSEGMPMINNDETVVEIK